MPESLGQVFALVGAESTGKSTLAAALAEQLAEATGLRCTWVPEALRTWCDEHQRTPLQHEHAEIVRLQCTAIDAARLTHDVVFADTTPLMTAVYHWQVFRSDELDASSLLWHGQCCSLALLTALDLPWVADGLQREGPHVREPVDARLRQLLLKGGLDFVVIRGHGPARLDAAMDAIRPFLHDKGVRRGDGLFTRLARREAQTPAWPWVCDCDIPECEHALRRSGSMQSTVGR